MILVAKLLAPSISLKSAKFWSSGTDALLISIFQIPRQKCVKESRKKCIPVVKAVTRTYRHQICQKCQKSPPKKQVIEIPVKKCYREQSDPICEPEYDQECQKVPDKVCSTSYEEDCTDVPEEICQPYLGKECRIEPMQVIYKPILSSANRRKMAKIETIWPLLFILSVPLPPGGKIYRFWVIWSIMIIHPLKTQIFQIFLGK